MSNQGRNTGTTIPPFNQDIATMYRAMLRMKEVIDNLQGQRGTSPLDQKITVVQQKAGAAQQAVDRNKVETDASLQTFGTRVQKIEDKNDEQDRRIAAAEKVNEEQDDAIDAATADRVIGIVSDSTPPTGVTEAWGWYVRAEANLTGMSAIRNNDGYGTAFQAAQLYIEDPAVTADGAERLFGRSGAKFIFNVPFALDGADIFDGTILNAALAAGAVTQLGTIKGALSASMDVNVRRDTSQVLVFCRFRYKDDPATVGSGKKGRIKVTLNGTGVADFVVLDLSEGGNPASRGYVITNASFQVENPTKGMHTVAISSTWDTSLGTDTEVSLTVLEFAA